MADLRAVLTGLGLRDVATYLASGNAVFTSDLDAPALEKAWTTVLALRDLTRG